MLPTATTNAARIIHLPIWLPRIVPWFISNLFFRKEISDLSPFDQCLLGSRSASKLRTWDHVSPLYRSTTLHLGLFRFLMDPDYGGSSFYISNVLLLGREWSGIIRTE